MTKIMMIYSPHFKGGVIMDVDDINPSERTTRVRKATSKISFMKGFCEHQVKEFCKLKGWTIELYKR